MRRTVLFRIRILATAAFLLVMHGSADALWLEVTNTANPEQAPLVVSLEGKEPVKGDQRHGLFALPPSYRDPNPNAMPRLALQYRADFPLTVTLAADGAIAGEKIGVAGGMNLSTGIIFSKAWWSPQVNASLADFSTLEMVNGNIEYGTAAVRSEWKVKF
jgi:hypothetical protein